MVIPPTAHLLACSSPGGSNAHCLIRLYRPHIRRSRAAHLSLTARCTSKAPSGGHQGTRHMHTAWASAQARATGDTIADPIVAVIRRGLRHRQARPEAERVRALLCLELAAADGYTFASPARTRTSTKSSVDELTRTGCAENHPQARLVKGERSRDSQCLGPYPSSRASSSRVNTRAPVQSSTSGVPGG